jgi:hypothetical protein
MIGADPADDGLVLSVDGAGPRRGVGTARGDHIEGEKSLSGARMGGFGREASQVVVGLAPLVQVDSDHGDFLWKHRFIVIASEKVYQKPLLRKSGFLPAFGLVPVMHFSSRSLQEVKL